MVLQFCHARTPQGKRESIPTSDCAAIMVRMEHITPIRAQETTSFLQMRQ
ncbi:hypothetical protein [Ruficoccus sp. ZRK36]|nr:hypothetical protein [Ruficoccus sp. ZRK36]QYY36991.1 hypothetical protein K0V07_05800 [Ruficoccus sp. ZRK36]